MLNALVQARSDQQAALHLMRKLLARQGHLPGILSPTGFAHNERQGVRLCPGLSIARTRV